MWKNKSILETFFLTSQEVGPKFPDKQKLLLVIHYYIKAAELAGPSSSLDPMVRYLER